MAKRYLPGGSCFFVVTIPSRRVNNVGREICVFDFSITVSPMRYVGNGVKNKEARVDAASRDCKDSS